MTKNSEKGYEKIYAVHRDAGNRAEMFGVSLTEQQAGAAVAAGGNLQRQGAVVLEEDDSLGRNLSCRGEMLRRSETAEMRLRTHGSAEDGAEDAAGFVIEPFLRGAAVPQALQIGIRQVVVGITVRCAVR